MLRRLLALSVLLTFALPAAALASPSVPPTDTGYIADGALFDKIVKTTASPTQNKAQGIQGYVITAHDDNYQYVLPLCANASLVEVNGNNIDPNAFTLGDTLVLTVQPNALADAKSCINRIVRQQISRGASSGECLQNYQVKPEIEGNPAPLLINQEYTYLLRIYARPTLDCDGKAYGNSPITTVVAPGKPFTVTLTQGSNPDPLMQWSLTTDAAGHASFVYTYKQPASDYKFQIAPGGGNTAGDVISWTAKVLDPHPSPSPTPNPKSSAPHLSIWPVVAVLALVLGGAAGMEYRHRLRKRREHELPEDEYRRTQRY